MFSKSIIEKLNIFEGMASGLVFSDKIFPSCSYNYSGNWIFLQALIDELMFTLWLANIMTLHPTGWAFDQMRLNEPD